MYRGIPCGRRLILPLKGDLPMDKYEFFLVLTLLLLIIVAIKA